ncbi:TetR family transcriptional regulator [Streptomyces niger]|uniref:TetR family transcriptional regulator n=1 Tax=Streptomyces niger TaxID=66373 RepID=UPI00069C1F45|nr:TetR family transcriptional regulator [Streptomyces niger]
MPYPKSEDTRRRLLDAATTDFAAHGIAGARVDRIAAAAGINKARLYAYFGDKLGLFDAVFRAHSQTVVDSVPFTADDLAQYATGLYEAALAQPELIRLAAWAQLEGVTPTNTAAAAPETGAKLQAITQAQRDGRVVSSLQAEDLLALVTSMALTWSDVGPSGTAQDTSPPDHERRKHALAETVRRAFHTREVSP